MSTAFYRITDRITCRVYNSDLGSERPRLVLCHGLYSNGSFYDYYVDRLRDEDIVVIVIDLYSRSSDEYARQILSSSPLTEVEDLRVLFDFLKSNGVIYDDVSILAHSQAALTCGLIADEYGFRNLFLISPAFNVPGDMAGVDLDLCGELVRIIPGLVSRRYVMDSVKISLDDVYSFDGQVIIFHGLKDRGVSVKYSVDACKHFRNCRLYKLKKQGHNVRSDRAKDYIIDKILEYML